MISDGLSKNQSEILLPKLLSTLDGGSDKPIHINYF